MKNQNIKLFVGISGQDVSVPVYEYGQGKPIVYIQGGVHGGEVTYFILHKLAQYLSQVESRLTGTVTIVPLCNPIAWNQRIYYYTVGKFDLYKGKDWNRSYPGADTTLSARISKRIFDIASRHSIVIDLHTARDSKPYAIFGRNESREIIRTLGIKYNYFIDFTSTVGEQFAGTLNYASAKKNILETTIECGGHDTYDENAIQEVFHSLQKLIDRYVLAKQPSKTSRKQYMFSNIKTLYAPTSGFVQFNIKPHDKCHAGDEIATIYTSHSLHKTMSYLAPYDGLVFELPRTTVVWEGDELVRIIPKQSIIKLK
ncbi:succinylglutamate desuccinylase/aspartoacylase family protein [Candidatus Woesebacteria bacterium]|nr:succinylglutamate desuccinylase/aspartoacylase family protein [Candidatus Woesebacteria bacterium]